MRTQPSVRSIIVGGLVAGTLDITYAVGFSAFHGVAPLRVLQSVASGLLGRAAYDGGVPTAVLGLCLHFCIMLAIASMFYLFSRRFAFLTEHAVAAGMMFGVIVYAAMNFVVLPLSAYPGKFNPDLMLLAANLFVHMVFIGLPIALAVRAGSARSAAALTEP